MSAPDYSVWLTPERLGAEEAQWALTGIYRLYAERLLEVAHLEGCASVLEIGCGTGWVPTVLPPSLRYLGVDANPDCVALAMTKSDRTFMVKDVRDLPAQEWADLVCAFAVLKHFALSEWRDVLQRVLSMGRVGLFTMNVGLQDADDFEQGFPHTWVSWDTLAGAVRSAGHEFVSTELLYTGELLVQARRR
jgi:SAM-dependent methyltransferase